ncbi:MAG: sulfate ABC transporter substrate-binding protein [Nodosilinea sp. LVE1205-7]|jgi:sulfate transport system substrate-binding protein
MNHLSLSPLSLSQVVSGYLANVQATVTASLPQASAVLLAAGIGLSTLLPAPVLAKTTQSTPPSQDQELLSQKPATLELTLVTYAVTKAAFDKIIPQFVEQWKRQNNGQEVIINGSYGGSGSQTRAVIDGLEADIVALALAGDVSKIQEAGLIDPGWEKEYPNSSIITNSVVALVTREGNPKGIRTWSDLAKPGIEVITANPKTSGGARWNFLGLWGSVTRTGGTEDQARALLQKVYGNTQVLPKDARESSDVFFTRGQGDVLLNYENEVILAAQQGQKGFFSVIPPVNIKIEGPVAVVDKNADKHGTRAVADAFIKFLFTAAAQREFAKVGFRPTDPNVAKDFASQFPTVSQLYTVAEFGGWTSVGLKFFSDGALFDRIYNGR